ncbi:DMT family transporter [Reyranella sp. CPCC 100927]|uniref:DMT family transporter n=1 Tax=Reyranella sp. CPCC 100927 TaxID=2599616 RepID=UPI0011B8247E|nr:DMT family transporter [Reyranella sp. CPCC 100927]TWT08652.1 DMT family transporter [Reyranella sp. CPCC 100927]
MTSTAGERQDGPDARAYVELASGMALSGTAGIFAVQSGQPTLNAVFFRCLFGCITLLIWCLLRGRARISLAIDKRTIWAAILSGLFLVLNWAALFEAYHRTSIGFATIIHNAQPFWLVLAGGILFGEKISLAKSVWVAVAFGGLVMAIGPKINVMTVDPGFAVGVGFALLASLFYAGTTLAARRVRGTRPEVLSILHCLIGAILFLPFLAYADFPTVDSAAWFWLAGLGAIHTGVVYVLLYRTYSRLPTVAIGVLAFLNPAAALLGDLVVYGRSITALQAVGLVLILVAGLGVTLGWRWPVRRA